MKSDLEALLALQADDEVIDSLEHRLEQLGPRAAALERQREASEAALARTAATVDQDEKRRRELEGRITDHKQRHQRNLAYLDTVKKMREATAAMAQVEQAKKVLLEEESELDTLTRRIADAHRSMQEQQQGLVDLQAAQEGERTALAEEKGVIEAELKEARAKRAEAATRVPRALLSRYDRIRGRRRGPALFALRNQSCGNCDTTVPLQRRHAMANGSSIEVCEVCGVLLYAAV